MALPTVIHYEASNGDKPLRSFSGEIFLRRSVSNRINAHDGSDERFGEIGRRGIGKSKWSIAPDTQILSGLHARSPPKHRCLSGLFFVFTLATPSRLPRADVFTYTLELYRFTVSDSLHNLQPQ